MPPQQVTSKLARASDGRMRIDYGNTSVITNPATGQAAMLDHVKKEVRTIPFPQANPAQPAPPQATLPGSPGGPSAAPPIPGMAVKDLGKRMVEGHEVEGKRYTLPAPAPPKPPPAPPAAGAPGLKTAGTPASPQIPEAGPVPPMITEVWTSTQHQFPVLTRTTGGFGKQTSHCTNLAGGEPPASLFQVPAGYKPAGGAAR